jgi:putative ABC transport system permease protein
MQHTRSARHCCVTRQPWPALPCFLHRHASGEQLQDMHVTSDYFKVFGAPMLLGRPFSAAEDTPDGPRVAVLSYGLWQRRFKSDPKILGTIISLGSMPYEVVGVVGKNFETEAPIDLWLPYQFEPNSTNFAGFFSIAARMRAGVQLEAVQSQMRLAAKEFRRQYPSSLSADAYFTVVPFQDALIGNTRPSLVILLVAVGFVLLIACANVANLSLLRASGRKRELATRAALGAGPIRIARQLLIESLILSHSAGILGLLFGLFGVRTLLRLIPPNLPRIGPDGSAITVDWRVLSFTFFVSLFTGILFGLIPAFQTGRLNLAEALTSSGTRSGIDVRTSKFRSALVISEIAMAIVLVVGASLLIRTLMSLTNVNPGFQSKNVLTLAMSLTGPRFQKTEGVSHVVRNGTERLNAIPGVLNAAASCCLPIQGAFGMPFDIVGRPKGSRPSLGAAGYVQASNGYFEALQIPILRGRGFTASDQQSTLPVAVISQKVARKYWQHGDPLKDLLVLGAGGGSAFTDKPRHIVGIVDDVHEDSLDGEMQPLIYIPLSQVPDSITALNSEMTPIFRIVQTRRPAHNASADLE